MTDITTRLLSMAEAMWMDRDHDEIDALLLEAKAEIERHASLIESGQDFANQVRAVVYKLQGQAYSSTVSTLNQFDVDLRRARAALIPQQKGNADAKQ
jgi:hypothetical protein